MQSKTILATLLISFFTCLMGFSQVSFQRDTDEKTIIAKLFETKYNPVDSTFMWIPNVSESIQFGTSIKDTLRTEIDTVFNYKDAYNEFKIILTTTYKFNDNCHGCQPILGIIELKSNDAKDSLNVSNTSKFVARYGTWGEAPKKRSLLQLGEDLYCVKITEYSSGMGYEAGVTSLYKDCKKIFSISSYATNNDAVEFDYQKHKYASTIQFDKKTNTIKIAKKGTEPNDSGKIIKVNCITTYKYDGEFLDKVSTVNLIPKK